MSAMGYHVSDLDAIRCDPLLGYYDAILQLYPKRSCNFVRFGFATWRHYMCKCHYKTHCYRQNSTDIFLMTVLLSTRLFIRLGRYHSNPESFNCAVKTTREILKLPSGRLHFIAFITETIGDLKHSRTVF